MSPSVFADPTLYRIVVLAVRWRWWTQQLGPCLMSFYYDGQLTTSLYWPCGQWLDPQVTWELHIMHQRLQLLYQKSQQSQVC